MLGERDVSGPVQNLESEARSDPAMTSFFSSLPAYLPPPAPFSFGYRTYE